MKNLEKFALVIGDGNTFREPHFEIIGKCLGKLKENIQDLHIEIGFPNKIGEKGAFSLGEGIS